MSLSNELLGKSQEEQAKIENPRLLQAMHEVALDDTPEKRTKVYAELLGATFILPTPELNAKPGVHIADGKMTLQLIGLKDASGKDVTPAFTDDEALRNWNPNTPSVGLRAVDCFKMVAGIAALQEVIINPFDPRRKMIRPGGRVTRREFEALAQGILPEAKPAVQTITPPAGMKLRFQKMVTAFPESAMEEIRKTLSQFEEVQSAFLLTIAYGEEKPHSAIAVRFSSGAPQERHRLLAKRVLETVRPLLAKGEAFDLIPMNPDLVKNVTRTTTPFYERAAN